MNKILLVLFVPLALYGQPFSKKEISQFEQQAQHIILIRDNWGVPHIYARTDAGAAFGLMYAQCEDNYWQLEETIVRSLGRAGEIYGEKELENDAAVALFECVKKGLESYATANLLLKRLCDAASNGINFYLEKHPEVEKRLLNRYEPWFFLVPSPLNPAGHGIAQSEIRNAFALSLKNVPSEGVDEWYVQQESGSNTIALAPNKTKSGHSMLLINPHLNFFGNGQRYEAHLVSEEGLNVSGFAMFGDFYIWSGFNEYAGWAHTNTASDFEDVYLERFNHSSDSSLYQYGIGYRKAILWSDTVQYRDDGRMKSKVFLFRKTHHGPITAKRDSLWVTIRTATNNKAQYILQVWAMCKAKNLREFTSAMDKRQLTTNTMYADRFGNIAYWHGNAIPRRDKKFDWRFPVEGSNTETEWMGMHPLKEIVQIINPSSKWIQNCNSTPYKAAGGSSPAKNKYPTYLAHDPPGFRADEAIRLLSKPGKISFIDFEHLVTSNHLPMMASWLSQIIVAYDREAGIHPTLQIKLKTVVDTLRKWDYHYATNSKATTIAVFWCTSYLNWIRTQLKNKFYAFSPYLTEFLYGERLPVPDSIAVQMINTATDTLLSRYGTAMIEWGEINRLQRIHTSGDLEKFNDQKISLPVGAVPGTMGSLFAFNSRNEAGQKRMYGISGNTYVAVIEFGKRIKAKSIMYFGQSAKPSSPNYFDQAPLYVEAKFKDVYFYRKDVIKHAARKYHPGE